MRREFRVAEEFVEWQARRFLEFVVFGIGAARLAHHPDGSARSFFAASGADKEVVFKVLQWFVPDVVWRLDEEL
ncbi:MAG: hypothetical protein AMXMBFR82_02970 [Candidatus Hydrogenedentota bacterium]